MTRDEKIKDIIDNHERYETLHDFVAALCGANEIKLTDLAKKLDFESIGGFSSSIIRHPNAAYRIAEKIWDQNLLHLPKEGRERAAAENALFSKTKNHIHWTSENLAKHRMKVVAEIRQAVLEQGPLPFFHDVLRKLFPEELFSPATLDIGIDAHRISHIFSGRLKPTADYELLLSKANVPQEAFDDFRALPTGPLKRQTPFGEALKDSLEELGLRHKDIESLSKDVRVDPEGKGISGTNISGYKLGKISPTQPTMRILAKALTLKILEHIPDSVNEYPPEIIYLIQSAGFKLEELFHTSHDVILNATLNDNLFDVIKSMRLATDINVNYPVFAQLIFPASGLLGEANSRAFMRPASQASRPCIRQTGGDDDVILPAHRRFQHDLFPQRRIDSGFGFLQSLFHSRPFLFQPETIVPMGGKSI